MKRVVLCLLIFIFLAGCSTLGNYNPFKKLPRLESWYFADQNPNEVGFVFLKLDPTKVIHPAIYTTFRSLWILTKVISIDPLKGEDSRIIETPWYRDGKYLFYPLKAGRYELLYQTFIVMSNNEHRTWNNYYIRFDIKPGEIAYLGSLKPEDKFNFQTSYNKEYANYNFISMEIHDDYNVDLEWLKGKWGNYLNDYKPHNYYSSIVGNK